MKQQESDGKLNNFIIDQWLWSQNKEDIIEEKPNDNEFQNDFTNDNKTTTSSDTTNNTETTTVTIHKLKTFFKSRVRSLPVIKHEVEPASTNDQIIKAAHKDKSLKQENSNQLYNDRDVDGGYAWIILAVMFVINASTFGTARAYGLIFEKLARQDEQSRAQAALPFTIMGAIENMGGPLTGYLLARTHSWRLTVFTGSCLITLSHLLASFCDSQSGQIMTIGLMCGLGLSFVTISSFQINNAYFVRFRSTAFGLGLTGAAFGTFYISPLCEYVLNNYNTNICYLMLSLILFPNVPLSLLLKPKEAAEEGEGENEKKTIRTISGKLDRDDKRVCLWWSIKQVLKNPLFHLIWPTQLLFCWFNFVFGMIIVDFGKDRGLDSSHVSQLIPIWAFGQLSGRIILGSMVDLKLVSYKYFTVICFASISLATWALNNIRSEDNEEILISLLVFILSMFISNLYILFNGLVVNYMDRSLRALSIGISSFTGSFFLLPRANIIGYYRDTIGNYDDMLTMFTYISLVAALVWLLMPELCSWLIRFISINSSNRKQSLSFASLTPNSAKC